MCGIFGFVGFIEPGVAEQCLRRLAHRGPDGESLWEEPGVVLGHRRLAILDPSPAGRQPMSYADGRYWITYNGEIYNFVELRRELTSAGHRFASDSDTEVILAAFVQWGESCQDRFNGMWAFAIWDRIDQALFLSRDRFGKKPLFYAQLASGFAFASEMKALFPLLPRVVPNVELVRDSARIFLYEASEECVIEGILRFPAGHSGWLRANKLSKRRWWCTLDHIPAAPSAYEEQVEQLRELFLDSCRIRMRSDVPLGTALSGGLDSSATVCGMAQTARIGFIERQGRDWQHAFVATFPGTPLDESRYAKRVTDSLGIPVTFIHIDVEQGLRNLYRYLYLLEDLYITSPIPFILTYAHVKRAGISVTLDGHGADEVFGGYSFDYLLALEDAGMRLGKVMEIIQTFRDGWPVGSSQFAAVPHPILYWAKWHLSRLKQQVAGRQRASVGIDGSHPAWRRLDAMSRQLYRSTHETVLPTLLRNYDRYSMASGVEIRMPFLDHRIVAFAFALPWTSKLRGGYSKAIVRDAVAPFVPPDIAYRKTKIGFNSPVVDWMKGPMREFLLDTVARRDFQECELIDIANTRQAIHRVLESPDATFLDGERAWTLLSPYLWERAVLKGAGAP